MMTVIWPLATVVCKQIIDDNVEIHLIFHAGSFDDRVYAAVQCGVHCQMEHTPGFTRSHWMPPSGKCLHWIAPAAAMIDEFFAKHKTLPKPYFYLANLW